jgi:hypothetical protein
MVKDRVAAFALMAAAGTMVNCSARVSDNDPPRDQGFSARGASDARGAALYPIRYGYRGGPYTHNGKPRPKTSVAPTGPEDVPPAPM